jgi:hypothetical protein
VVVVRVFRGGHAAAVLPLVDTGASRHGVGAGLAAGWLAGWLLWDPLGGAPRRSRVSAVRQIRVRVVVAAESFAEGPHTESLHGRMMRKGGKSTDADDLASGRGLVWRARREIFRRMQTSFCASVGWRGNPMGPPRATGELLDVEDGEAMIWLQRVGRCGFKVTRAGGVRLPLPYCRPGRGGGQAWLAVTISPRNGP